MIYHETEHGILYHGDCLDILPMLASNSVDLCVTSPPYNIGIDYGENKDNLSWKEYYKWCSLWLGLIYQSMKCDGRFCINGYLSMGRSDNRHSPLMDINHLCVTNIGYKHHGLALWWDITRTKYTAWGSWLSASAPYINSPIEGILILYKEFWKKQDSGKTEISKEEFMESCGGIWHINTERNRTHPAPFPVKLPERCIKLFSWESNIVLDPFAGSGTTAIACINTKRRYILIEKEEKYCEISARRIEAILAQTEIAL